MKRIPAFTVILLMIVAALVGVVSIPGLNVQYVPSTAGRSVSVSWDWNDASARVMEAEVTSKIEGVLSSLRNVTDLSSVSEYGRGRVEMEFRKGTDMTAVRFEIASKIRNIYPSLPEGVTYPWISLDTRGGKSREAVSFTISSPLPSMEIYKFVSDRLLVPLSAVEGVDRVSFSGITPYEMEITFDSRKAASAGITGPDIARAFNESRIGTEIGLAESGGGTFALRLKERTAEDPGAIPIKNVEGRIVRLRDVATWKIKEAEPESYYRMNGLNTMQLSVTAAPNVNLLTTVSSVKEKMASLSEEFPSEISYKTGYDSSEYVSKELNKTYFRTLLCILILLVFVFLVNRSPRYLFIISATLAVDVLAAIALYRFFGIEIHIYTLAGITVSLGIIIDTSIVMTDHYSYYHDRSVFPALLGATATTIGALCVIALLPEADRRNLMDFCKAIIINLSVALVTAGLFIPSLIDRFPVPRSSYSLSIRRRKRVIRWNRLYERYIVWGRRHRWALSLALVTAFGIPLCLLPKEVGKDKDEKNFWERTYNGVVGWKPYADNRDRIDKVVGTSFALFNKALGRSDFYREPGRDILYVAAGMPEGCSVGQLNEVIKAMENYLARFEEIEMFTTRISSYDDGLIEITFKPEYEHTSFPSELKSMVTSMAINFGGANWRVWGVNDNYFNNNIITNYKQNRIDLTGYNYDQLLEYADILLEDLSQKKRVSAPAMVNSYGREGKNEYSLDYDFRNMAAHGVSAYDYYLRLHSVLYDTRLEDYENGGLPVSTVLRSADADEFDLWHVENALLDVDSTGVKLGEMGSVTKKRTGLSINKVNQNYRVSVGYDFVGSYELSKKMMEDEIDHMNNEVLPVGYKASKPDWSWHETSKLEYAWLILLVIAIIYVMCAMIFNSVRLPFAVVLMIPVSFVGVFLTFGLSDFVFDQGGFAAFVLLSGIVVNSGIYLINAFKKEKDEHSGKGRPAGGDTGYYIRAYNHKINAILLTVISTVLGLIPFLLDGPDEVFWFAFAAGTIGGLLFSLIALVLYLPVFVKKI